MKGLQISSWMERDQKAQTLCQLRIQRNFWPLSHDSAAQSGSLSALPGHPPCWRHGFLFGQFVFAKSYKFWPSFAALPPTMWALANSVRVTCSWRQFLVKFQVLVFSCKKCRKMFVYAKKKKKKRKYAEPPPTPPKVSRQWRLALGEHICTSAHPQTNPQSSLNTILFHWAFSGWNFFHFMICMSFF